tara:strand:+ start:19724 stop:19957 length:234 start_codon:yes stop_codon:yes gene_type:complete
MRLTNYEMNANFSFLKHQYSNLFAISELSEQLIYVDPSSSFSKSRLFSEKLGQLIWDFEELGEFVGSQNVSSLTSSL